MRKNSTGLQSISCFPRSSPVVDGLAVRRFNDRMNKPKILIQLDTDAKASVFDAVVAVDSGVDHLLQYAGIEPGDVRGLIHGAMYTRGPSDLKNTAVFVGGSDVSAGEVIAKCARETLFDPFRVSIMLDSNGANSTAAAAVLSATKHISLQGASAMVLAATGPVGQRVCRILANAGCKVFVASRVIDRAVDCVQRLLQQGLPANLLEPLSSSNESDIEKSLDKCNAVFACGAAGAKLLSQDQLRQATGLQVAVDLNAVPPVGIEGVSIMDKGVQRDSRFDYGALGVGGLKMKIHKACIAALFESNHAFLDCQEMMEIGEQILRSSK